MLFQTCTASFQQRIPGGLVYLTYSFPILKSREDCSTRLLCKLLQCLYLIYHGLKKKSQSVDITAPGFNPLAGAGKPMPQASKPPAPKTPIIEEEQNNAANTQKHPSRRSELKRFYTIE
ncbi:oxidation resistance protein 1 isoform X1 [Prionailurus iriomotensis]